MLEDFIETNQISAEIKVFDEEVKTVSQALALEKTLPIVKTIVCVHDTGMVLAILPATKKVNMKRLETLTHSQSIRLATPEEVLNATGYEVGGVPPVSIYGIPSIIDPSVLSLTWVWAGGGSKFALLKIQTNDILTHAYEPTVEKIVAD